MIQTVNNACLAVAPLIRTKHDHGASCGRCRAIILGWRVLHGPLPRRNAQVRAQPQAASSPSAQAILETLARAVLVYGRRNARILYDALGTLAEAVHGALAEPMFLTVIMPPLVQKWQASPPMERPGVDARAPFAMRPSCRHPPQPCTMAPCQ